MPPPVDRERRPTRPSRLATMVQCPSGIAPYQGGICSCFLERKRCRVRRVQCPAGALHHGRIQVLPYLPTIVAYRHCPVCGLACSEIGGMPLWGIPPYENLSLTVADVVHPTAIGA